MSDARAPGDASITEWQALSDALLRGLVHALNNRLTALSAFSELVTARDEEFAAERVIPAEVGRIEELGRLFRLLATEQAGDEAMALAPVLDEALALHAHHAGFRGARCTVEYAGTVPPAGATVRAPRWALVRLVLLLLESATRAALESGRASAVLRVVADEQRITLHPVGAMASRHAMAMARCCGATDDAAGAVHLPTLPELRRRERPGRDAAGA